MLDFLYKKLNEFFFHEYDLDISKKAARVVEKQMIKKIKKINKALLKSLKEKPEGYASVRITFDEREKDLQRKIKEYYENLGYKVEKDNWYDNIIIISIKNWSKRVNKENN